MTDWRHLPVTSESLTYVRDNVRCKCGHSPLDHYDMTSFCVRCLDDDDPCDCEEFIDHQPTRAERANQEADLANPLHSNPPTSEEDTDATD